MTKLEYEPKRPREPGSWKAALIAVVVVLWCVFGIALLVSAFLAASP